MNLAKKIKNNDKIPWYPVCHIPMTGKPVVRFYKKAAT
tara:strand:- start:385 stop:498 length:114 start_codon:yes stop_codon:yes gene_type:complete